MPGLYELLGHCFVFVSPSELSGKNGKLFQDEGDPTYPARASGVQSEGL